MYVSARNTIGLLILAVAAVATWLASHREVEPQSGVSPASQTQLGYYLRDAVFFGTDQDGRIFYRVHAALAEQQPDEEGLTLSQVHVEYRDTEHVQWQLSAEHAAARSGVDRLDLQGNVRLASQPREDEMPTVIETDSLRLEADQFIASSDAPVQISVGSVLLKAKGMKAHLKDDRVELESDVHGQLFN